MEFSTWQLSDQVVTQTKAKLCFLKSDQQAISIIPTQTPIRTPFGPGTFDKTQAQTTGRQTLEFRCNADILAWFAQFDKWAIADLTEHSERLFKKTMMKE